MSQSCCRCVHLCPSSPAASMGLPLPPPAQVVIVIRKAGAMASPALVVLSPMATGRRGQPPPLIPSAVVLTVTHIVSSSALAPAAPAAPGAAAGRSTGGSSGFSDPVVPRLSHYEGTAPVNAVLPKVRIFPRALLLVRLTLHGQRARGMPLSRVRSLLWLPGSLSAAVDDCSCFRRLSTGQWLCLTLGFHFARSLL